MKSITAAIALAVGCISTPVLAWNIFDTLNVVRTINDTARTAAIVQQAQQPVVVVAPAITYVPNSNVADGVVCHDIWINGSIQGVPCATVFDKPAGYVAPAIIDNGNGDQAAFIAARNVASVATDCPVTVVDNTDGRVCIKTDKGAVVCGTYVGPQL